MIFGSGPNESNTLNDSISQELSNPVLRVKGTRVFKDKTLLKKSEVLNILSSNPTVAKKYARGMRTRSTGTALIISGIIAFAGGIGLMVSGIENNTADNYYYSYTYTSYGTNYYVGLIIGTLGELIVDGGIACSVIGKITIRRSIGDYNNSPKQTFYIPGSMNYQIGMLDNGRLGIKISF